MTTFETIARLFLFWSGVAMWAFFFLALGVHVANRKGRTDFAWRGGKATFRQQDEESEHESDGQGIFLQRWEER